MSKKKKFIGRDGIVEFINGEPVYDCEFEPLDEEGNSTEGNSMHEWEELGRVIEDKIRENAEDIDFEKIDEQIYVPQPRTWEEVTRKWNRASDMVINEQISKHELDAFADEVIGEYNKQHKEEVGKMSRLWWQRMGAVVVALILAVVLQLIFIEWMVGCGESYVDADGVRHWYECVFLNFNPKGGQ